MRPSASCPTAVPPTGASVWSFAAAVPRATRTAVPGASPTGPFCEKLATVAVISVFGVEAGKPESATAYEPVSRGVDAP